MSFFLILSGYSFCHVYRRRDTPYREFVDYVPDPVAVLGHISVYRLRVCLYSVFITLGIIVVSFRRSLSRSPEYYIYNCSLSLVSW